MMERKLFFWDARGLYIGPAFGLRPHRNAVAVFCVALDASASLAHYPLCPAQGGFAFKTALIPPNTLHHLHAAEDQRMAFLYIDALSDDYTRLLWTMRLHGARVATMHEREQTLIEALRALAAGACWRDARDALTTLLGLTPAQTRDPRIVDALTRLRDAPDDRHSLTQCAQHAGLSASYFLHLFKAQTGVPFRRYRLWIRMGAALKAVRAGHSLTDAAHAAGFSSSAHFSTAFTGMFGLPPSRLSGPDIIAAASEVRPRGPRCQESNALYS
ncbi:MAG: AraC family transcriptional regulator [Luteimonas sp.]